MPVSARFRCRRGVVCDRVRDRTDAGQPSFKLVVQLVAGGERGGRRICELRLILVGPDEDLQWQVKGGQWCCLHDGGSGLGAAEDHHLGVTQLQPDATRLAAVVDHREQLQAAVGDDIRQAGDGVGYRHRADLRDQLGARARGHDLLLFIRGLRVRAPPA